MNAAAASSSGGAAGSPAARSRNASRRKATEGAVTGRSSRRGRPRHRAGARARRGGDRAATTRDREPRPPPRKRWARLSASASTIAASAAAAASGAASTARCKCSGQPVSPALASAIPRSSSKPGRSAGGGGSSSARRRKTAADSGAPCFRRRARGLDEPLDDPIVGRGLAASRCSATRSSAPGCSASSRAARRWPCARSARGELRIEAGADDRMDERQRPAGLEDARGRQQLGRVGGLDLVETREARRLEQVALLEDRQRPREPPGRLRAADGAGGESSDRPFARRCARLAAARVGRRLPRSGRRRARARGTASLELRAGRRRRTSGSGARRALDSTKLGRRRLSSAEPDGSHRRRDRSSASRAAQHRCPPREGGSRRRARRPALRAA